MLKAPRLVEALPHVGQWTLTGERAILLQAGLRVDYFLQNGVGEVLVNNAQIHEKYGLDLIGLKKNARGYRVWTPEHREQLVKLTHRFSVPEISEDLGISSTWLHALIKKTEGITVSRRQQVSDGEATDVVLENGFPTRPKAGRPRKAAISFQAADVASAAAILSQLQGQKGKVTITIE